MLNPGCSICIHGVRDTLMPHYWGGLMISARLMCKWGWPPDCFAWMGGRISFRFCFCTTDVSCACEWGGEQCSGKNPRTLLRLSPTGTAEPTTWWGPV